MPALPTCLDPALPEGDPIHPRTFHSGKLASLLCSKELALGLCNTQLKGTQTVHMPRGLHFTHLPWNHRIPDGTKNSSFTRNTGPSRSGPHPLPPPPCTLRLSFSKLATQLHIHTMLFPAFGPLLLLSPLHPPTWTPRCLLILYHLIQA